MAPKMNQTKRLLNVRETLDVLSISRTSLYRLMGRGKLHGRKIGKMVRFDIDEVNALIDGLPAAKIASPTS